jgi:hypothetical protein
MEVSDMNSMPTPDKAAAIAAELAAAAAAEQAKADSWERSDTDGFLSQWASGLNANLHRAKAELLANDGMDEFPALFRDGVLVAAKLIETRYGLKWGVLASDDPRSTVTLWFSPTARAAKKHGYTIGTVKAPAVAFMDGKGYGMSGSAWVAVKRTDKGFSRDVEVVSTDDRMEG